MNGLPWPDWLLSKAPPIKGYTRVAVNSPNLARVNNPDSKIKNGC